MISSHFLYIAVEKLFPRIIAATFVETKPIMANIIKDLGINAAFIKGQTIPVNNCWHFTIDGDAAGIIYYDSLDFIDGMNRVYTLYKSFPVVVLAFVLMDTHFHFVLYGPFDVCNKFVHEYVRRTSMSLAHRHGESQKLGCVDISHQVVDDDRYLKTVICYTIKNPTVAGLPYTPWEYPWSSGPLYFRSPGTWTSPAWLKEDNTSSVPKLYRERRAILHNPSVDCNEARMVGPVVFPGDYVRTDIVEAIFKSPKSYLYFLGSSKEVEVDSRGGIISHLSIPIQEMRENRKRVAMELFGQADLRMLNTTQRVRLAKVLKSRYNSSLKQISRLCGLMYDEIKDII